MVCSLSYEEEGKRQHITVYEDGVVFSIRRGWDRQLKTLFEYLEMS